MTLNEIISLFEENYEEITVYDHIDAWSKEIALGYRTFALCTFVNKPHDCVIQTMVWYPPNDDLDDSPIYQTYIAYTEDPENKIYKAFRYIESEDKRPIDYSVYSMLEPDMGWIEEQPIEQQEEPIDENIEEIPEEIVEEIPEENIEEV